MKLRLKKHTSNLLKSSWFITLFATTLGVLLALHLNNLNSKIKIEEKKQLAIKNIEKELILNKEEIDDSEDNDKLLKFLEKVDKENKGITKKLYLSSTSMKEILTQYPNYIEIIDSTKTIKDEYVYNVNYQFGLGLDNLQKIAWETSQMSDIINELSYECLQTIVTTYSLQEIYTKEQQKLTNHLINEDFNKIFKSMSILKNLKLQLSEAISEAKELIKNCG